MRNLVIGFLAFAGVLAGCDDHWNDYGWHGRGESANQVVFGINQTSAALSKREVSAGYEFVTLAKQGGSNPVDFSEDDGEVSCTFERFDERIGAAHVEGGGTAVWSGGKLAQGGLPVVANQTERAHADGEGWATGDRLEFDVTGFALPDIRHQELRAPAAELTVSSVTPSVLTLTGNEDIDVAWIAVTEDRPSRIMISLDSDEGTNAGGGVRCFGNASLGHASIPKAWVSALIQSIDASLPKKGKLSVSTHRQNAVRAQGDWTIYVVATTTHFEQDWTAAP